MGKIIVWRVYGSDRTKLGEFVDGYHATLFLKAILAEAWEDGLHGTLEIEYDYNGEQG